MEAVQTQYLNNNGFEDVKNFEGLYKINPAGEVWSCNNKIMMKPQEQEGYLTISLTKSGTKHKSYIHRLLAIQFIPNENNYPEVDHFDRDRANNKLENLRWADKTIQNNNKSTNIALLTEEQKEEKKVDIREYKRVWAEADRRAKGVPVKEKIKTENVAEYKKLKMREYRADMTDAERTEHNAKRRETRPEQTEEQKEKARERARKQRADKKAKA
jgi:hypothetical protein